MTDLSFAVHGSAALLRVNARTQEGRFPGVDIILRLTRELQRFPIFTDVATLWVVDSKHMSPRHKACLHIPQLQIVQGKHKLFVAFLRKDIKKDSLAI